MKKILFASLLLSFSLLSFCQGKKGINIDKKADSLRAKPLPEFKILTDLKGKDSVWFTNANLPTNRPIVLVYFSPECGHCQHETKEFVKNMDSLKNAFFVFASRFPIDTIKNFAEKYEVTKYSNIVIGKEDVYNIPVYYNIKFIPFVALYDTQRNFVKSYDSGADMPELIKLINDMPVEKVADKRSKRKAGAN